MRAGCASKNTLSSGNESALMASASAAITLSSADAALILHAGARQCCLEHSCSRSGCGRSELSSSNIALEWVWRANRPYNRVEARSQITSRASFHAYCTTSACAPPYMPVHLCMYVPRALPYGHICRAACASRGQPAPLYARPTHASPACARRHGAFPPSVRSCPQLTPAPGAELRR
jgi:hypothetical protein